MQYFSSGIYYWDFAKWKKVWRFVFLHFIEKMKHRIFGLMTSAERKRNLFSFSHSHIFVGSKSLSTATALSACVFMHAQEFTCRNKTKTHFSLSPGWINADTSQTIYYYYLYSRMCINTFFVYDMFSLSKSRSWLKRFKGKPTNRFMCRCTLVT